MLLAAAVSVLVTVLQAQSVLGEDLDCQAIINAGNCSFYDLCVEKQLPCGTKGYHIDYGRRYCDAFDERAVEFNAEGRDWLLTMRSCLAQTLFNSSHYTGGPSCPDNAACCQRAKYFAFGSHSDCSFNSGFCTSVFQDSTNLKAIFRLFHTHPPGLPVDKTMTLDQIMGICVKCEALLGATTMRETINEFIGSAEGDFLEFLLQMRRRLAMDCRKPIDIIIAIDSSRSIGANGFTELKNFASNLIENLEDTRNLRVGVMTFSSSTSMAIPLETVTNKISLAKSIQKIDYLEGESAAIYLALDEIRSTLSNSTSISVGILLTGSQSNSSNLATTAAKEVHDAGIHMYTFGTGNSDLTELAKIASQPTSEYNFDIESFATSKFSKLLQNVKTQACTTPQVQQTYKIEKFQVRKGERIYLQYPFNRKGATIYVNVEEGSVKVYGAFFIPNPGKTTADFSFNTNSFRTYFVTRKAFKRSTGMKLPSRKKNKALGDAAPNFTLFVAIVGAEATNTYEVTVSPGNNCEKTSKMLSASNPGLPVTLAAHCQFNACRFTDRS